MARKTYWELFKVNPDGSVEPKVRVQIGGVQFGPGVRFGRGVAFGGIDLTMYIGHDLEIDEKDGVSTITGIY